MEPHWSHVTYLDSGRAVPKDYSNIKVVLNNALNDFAAELGRPLKKEKVVRGTYVCTHQTQFPCLKQTERGLETWYAILQMMEYVKDAQDLLLPSDLQNKSTNMAETSDAYIRAQFRRIQRKICTIIHSDVTTRGGTFFPGHLPPSNHDIQTRLLVQRDMRTFNTLEGIRPFPPKP